MPYLARLFQHQLARSDGILKDSEAVKHPQLLMIPMVPRGTRLLSQFPARRLSPIASYGPCADCSQAGLRLTAACLKLVQTQVASKIKIKKNNLLYDPQLVFLLPLTEGLITEIQPQ